MEHFSLHTHGYKYYSIEINHRKWGIEMLIFKITRSVLAYPVLHKNCHAYFYQFSHLLNIMISTTQTLAQIKTQEFIDDTKQNFMTSPVTYVTNDIQDCF